MTRLLLNCASRANRSPAVFYLHPWEIDLEQPRQRAAPFLSRFRHYLNLERTEPRLRRLLRDFAWTRMDRLFLGAGAGPFPVIASWTDRKRRSAVRPFRAGDERPWDDFVLGQPNGTFFHLSGWKRVIERAFRHRTYYLIAERGGFFAGVLPARPCQVSDFRFVPDIERLRGAWRAARRGCASVRALEGAALKLMEDLAVPVLELRDFSASRADWPSRSDLYAVSAGSRSRPSTAT